MLRLYRQSARSRSIMVSDEAVPRRIGNRIESLEQDVPIWAHGTEISQLGAFSFRMFSSPFVATVARRWFRGTAHRLATRLRQFFFG
ncbi:MAG: hypothetical protein O3A00_06540 [Planctomycetota bacterium]|nr:hypothetical protein [Planctomycetota bacterium]